MRPAIEVAHVDKSFKIYKELNRTLKSAILRGRRSVAEPFQALSDVSLEIPQGSTFALVGDNGSGKSTLLKCLAKILVPDAGTIVTRGRLAAMLEVGSGFHPELSGRENIFLNGSILGMKRKEIESRFDEIVAFSGVEDFIDQPVKNYSSGMYVRLGFSVAIHTEPEILLVDEILAVGDAPFQAKCAQKFAQLQREGRTVVLVSHALDQVKTMADSAVWLSHGKVVEVGEARSVIDNYANSGRHNLIVDAEGKTRWGSGEARVTRVEMLSGESGISAGSLPTGSPLTLRLHYEASQQIDSPVFGFSLETADGSYLWGNNTRDLKFPVEHIEGSGAVDLTIPSLHLQPGQYYFHGSIVNETTEHVFDYVREIAHLGITPAQPIESGGPLSLDGRWSWPKERHD